MGYLLVALIWILGIRGENDDGKLRWQRKNPVSWVLVFIGSVLSIFVGCNPFKVFINSFKNDRMWNGM